MSLGVNTGHYGYGQNPEFLIYLWVTPKPNPNFLGGEVTTVVVVTTFPNASIASQIGKKAMEARLEVAHQAALADSLAGYPLVGLCEPDMKSVFKSTGAILVRPEVPEPMGPGRRQVIQHGVDIIGDPKQYSVRPAILWREPEKDIAEFVSELVNPIQKGEADISIMNRLSLSSYPSWGQHWERLGTATSAKIIGVPGPDYYSGPRAMSVLAAGYFLRYPGEQKGLPDWHDSIGCPVIDAAFDGLRITGVEVDFQYPTLQRDAEEDDLATIEKRMKVQFVLFNSMLARRRWLEARRKA